MKYNKSPCNLDDCDHWTTKPELCEKCMDTVFTFESLVRLKIEPEPVVVYNAGTQTTEWYFANGDILYKKGD